MHIGRDCEIEQGCMPSHPAQILLHQLLVEWEVMHQCVMYKHLSDLATTN